MRSQGAIPASVRVADAILATSMAVAFIALLAALTILPPTTWRGSFTEILNSGGP